jgi:hypothetical protein
MADRAGARVGARTFATRGVVLAVALAITALGALWMAAQSDAAPKITAFTAEVSSSEAGAHPDFDIAATFDTRNTVPDPFECLCADPSEVITQFPPGVIGNPHALPTCTLLQLSSHKCPIAAQVGVASAIAGEQPLYNMEPHPGEAGLLGFSAPLIEGAVFVSLSARTDSDYGLTTRTQGIFHLAPLTVFELHLWGVPGDPKHDANRWPGDQTGICAEHYPEVCGPPQSFDAPVRPYFENPTACGPEVGPLEFTIDAVFYDRTRAHASAPWPATTNCAQLSFNPSLSADPTTDQADTASGLDVDLRVPQTQSPTTPSPSEIRAVTTTLPRGFSISPSAADGKTACTDQEGSFGTVDAARCPEHSKVGTLSLDSSALPGPISGAIYLGQPLPGDRYRLFLAADGYATHVKIAGTVRPDPADGRVTVSFPNLPQSPFQQFSMHFFGSERGLLTTPTACGTYAVETTFVPWDAVLPNQTSTSFFAINSGPGGSSCPGQTRPLRPQFRAGSADNTAGAYSPFGLEVARPDGDQNVTGLDITTPPGFLAKLAGVSYCPDGALASLADPGYSGLAETASPACPASSLIGTAVTSVGAGSRPLFTSGRVYLTGPYKGAPIGLAIVVPAVAGPYDLGNVIVRAAAHIDPRTARITELSDEIPQIIGGIPLRLRSIQVNLDRPGFALNPTGCDRSATTARVLGNEGASADLASPFQVANCASLDFGPKLSLRLSGGVKRRGHPAIHATLAAKPGESNIARVSAALPKGELLDNDHLGSPCTRPQFDADNCPAGSQLGTAEAVTPLLDQPLRGKVYLRTSPNHKLPDIVADLEGQIDIELVGKVDTVHGGSLRTTFEGVPDAPVTSFHLDLEGGARGLLQNSKSLCGKPKRAEVKMSGHNGAVVKSKPKLKVTCGNARHKRGAARKGRG